MSQKQRVFLLNVWKLCCSIGDIDGAQKAFTELYPGKGYKPKHITELWSW